MIDLGVKLRAHIDDDKDFIFDTWANNQRSVGFNTRIKKGEFTRFLKHFLICRLPEMNILVACNSEYEDQIYGYIVYSDYEKLKINCVHFLYVKSMYRNNHIARELLKNSVLIPKYYSCMPSNREARKIIGNAIYNPFLFYATETETNEFLQSKDGEIRRDN